MSLLLDRCNSVFTYSMPTRISDLASDTALSVGEILAVSSISVHVLGSPDLISWISQRSGVSRAGVSS